MRAPDLHRRNHCRQIYLSGGAEAPERLRSPPIYPSTRRKRTARHRASPASHRRSVSSLSSAIALVLPASHLPYSEHLPAKPWLLLKKMGRQGTRIPSSSAQEIDYRDSPEAWRAGLWTV